MVAEQLEARGISDPRVLQAMRTVPRENFVSPLQHELAYEDRALRIEHEQTISQPYVVALMTEAIHPTKEMRVLEIGTGSGYQAAILSHVVAEVFSIERIHALAHDAAKTFQALNIQNIRQTVGDGSLGWPSHAPFDAILVTAGAPSIPPALLQQLGDGGTMVIPVGPQKRQQLVQVQKVQGHIRRRNMIDCRFVRLLGSAAWSRDADEPQGRTTNEE